MSQARTNGRRIALLAALATALVGMLASTAAADDRALAHGVGCSTFGPAWAHTYNSRAIVAGNPVRILSACCTPTETVGVNHCFVTVTLAGTLDRGCETVDIGRNGWPSGAGHHQKCVSLRQQIA